MATLKIKANIGMAMMLLFVVVLISGVILHMKKHGVLIEPRYIIKIIHWSSGFGMCVLAAIHRKQFGNMLCALKSKAKVFVSATKLLTATLILTFVTGAVKLLLPVKIPHLGLWHYGIGIAMSIAILIHLWRGIPAWYRLRKACKKEIER